MNFKPPIESLVSPRPDVIGKATLDPVVEYCAEIEEVNHTDVSSHGDNIKNADPYASDPYDKLIKIKHQVNSLCIELMELQVFTEKELNVFFSEDDRMALIERIRTSQFLLESGVFRDFCLTKSYAVRICREMLELIRYYRKCFYRAYFTLGDSLNGVEDEKTKEEKEAEKKEDDKKQKKKKKIWFICEEDYFVLLRYMYINIGKMHALAHYFEQNKIKAETVERKSKKSERLYYKAEVKEVLLELLAEKYEHRGERFKTISSAIREVKNDFQIRYHLMQESNVDQQYFDIEHIDRNFKKYLKSDDAYRNAVSQFINLKH
ncbi:hypothetical protein [Comamonas koreensis]|uniref:hypothetical protein n=1 Tax=Comamonas koreensis TaxID=160825 RepID=UPI0015FA45F9|nr:hypothetical protein [Comamonas koreensis]